MADVVLGPNSARIQAKNLVDLSSHPAKRRRDALEAYRAALAVPDPGEQLRARFAALMDLAAARGGE